MRFVQLFLAVALAMATLNAQAFEWRNLWSTPEQRAANNLEQENFDTLVQEAPNAAWQGIGEYRMGDYEAASESFSKQYEQALSNGSTSDMVSAQYNRANAEVLGGNYEQALNLYDEVLELEPNHEDAKHNYEIARQLWKQQQNNQQNSEQQNSDSSDQQQDQQQNQQQQQQQEQQQQNNQSSEQQQDAGESGQQENQNRDQSSAESQQAEDRKAADAMQAERDRQNEDQDSQSNQFTQQQPDEQASTGSNNQLTEQEQATEQWLRQIPDDPAGLLQRKLQNRHMTDYPEVRDSAKPW